jgi:hypothetical protein
MSLEILGWEGTWSPPDDDGDVRLRSKATVEVIAPAALDRLVLRTVFSGPDGLPGKADETTEEGDWVSGDTEQIRGSAYAKLPDGEGWTARLFVDGYAMSRAQIGRFPLGGEGLVAGSGEPKDLDGLRLVSWSATVEPADDDGDHRLRVLAVVEVGVDAKLAELELHQRVLNRHGEEADSDTETVHSPGPGSTVIIEASSWLKPRRLGRGAELELALRAWSHAASASTEPVNLELGRR